MNHIGVSRKKILSADQAALPRKRTRQPLPRPAQYGEDDGGLYNGVESGTHVPAGGHLTPGCFITPARNGGWG